MELEFQEGWRFLGKIPNSNNVLGLLDLYKHFYMEIVDSAFLHL